MFRVMVRIRVRIRYSVILDIRDVINDFSIVFAVMLRLTWNLWGKY